MNQEHDRFLIIMIVYIFLVSLDIEAQSQPPPMSKLDAVSSFRPSMGIVIGILSIMFSLTFLLLLYAKFCHTATSDLLHRSIDRQIPNGLIQTRSKRFSGIDKTVIESLPFFRFSSLKGSKEGLECSVCLSKFEETEILRLLPKCKHAFHVSCVDQWLESHSSCPLCRHKVDPQDMNIFTYSSSMRFSRNQSDLTDDPNLELFVRREEADDRGSSRFSVGSSFRMMIENDKEGIGLPFHEVISNNNDHELAVSDVVLKSRWSDVNSSDLISLNSELLNLTSTTRFSCDLHSAYHLHNTESTKIKEEIERRRVFDSKIGRIERSNSVSCPVNLPSSSVDNSRLLAQSGKRAMSEITKVSRFADIIGGRKRIEEGSSGENGGREEMTRKLWFPIARRTVEWIAGREIRSKQSHYSRQLSVV